MSMLDLLSALSTSAAGGSAAPAANAQDPSQAAPVPEGHSDDIVVTAKRPKPPPAPAPNIAQKAAPPPTPGTYPDRLNGEGANTIYNNVPQFNAMQDVAQHYASNPSQEGGNGLGLANLLHLSTQGGGGTLRNVLGTLGDAFLISSGHEPLHRQAEERQAIADASAGMDTNPMAAASRIAATGATGSQNDAQSLMQQAENEKLREATMANTQAYRDQVLGERQNYHDQQTDARQGALLQRQMPYIGGLISKVKNADQYQAASSRALLMAQRIKPDATLADLGLPDPKDWQPGMTDGYGMTSGQQVRNDQGQERIDQQGQLGRARIAASYASIGERAHAAAAAQAGANARSMPLHIQQIQHKVDAGQQLSPGEQAVWNHATNISRGGGSHINIPGARPAPGGGVPQGAVAMLRGNPGLRAQFDQKYGPGASARILGH